MDTRLICQIVGTFFFLAIPIFLGMLPYIVEKFGDKKN